MYAKINGITVTQYPYTFADLCADNPATSFPSDPDAETLAPFDAIIVEPSTKPEPLYNQYVVEGNPSLVDGVWRQVWEVVAFTEAEMVVKTSQQWSHVRAMRNQLLLECDWTDLPHCPLSAEKIAEWLDYRTLLRNITDNPDPFNLTWPTPPL